jgi:hypothetical protein
MALATSEGNSAFPPTSGDNGDAVPKRIYQSVQSNSRVTSSLLGEVFSPSLREPLEFVHLRLRVAFRHVALLNPVGQKFLDLVFGEVLILLTDTPHGLIKIEATDIGPEEFTFLSVEAHILQQNLEFVGNLVP